MAIASGLTETALPYEHNGSVMIQYCAGVLEQKRDKVREQQQALPTSKIAFEACESVSLRLALIPN